eukprot:CAMPEP_0116041002 /NCGR_PEP_ID=MMETSP0321-20121206/24736_1 /TAXON_ID=163516 /ORGANISM="Leptocylindrus danicus var. danicus, Strain B650" /LENGTH=344 /DNA_ID=CAMNT_0003521007 /DNA_START=180 /DNA_END=1214 /DNA_ORIENTATION=-
MNFNLDLEESIFQKNVPGRYTSWELEQEDCRNEGDNDDAVHNSGVEVMEKPSSIAECTNHNIGPIQSRMQNSKSSHNTGVKGIMNDYRNHKALEKQHRLLEQEQRRNILHRQVSGACLVKGEVSLSRSAQIQRERIEKSKSHGSFGDDSSSEDEDADIEFLKLYREKRMKEVCLPKNQERAHFGEICEVSPFEFSTTIDEAGPCIYVVVHLYEPTLYACEVLNRSLEHVARSMAHVKFLRLQALQASADFDPIVLPTLMVYRAGALVQNLIRVSDELPCGYGANDLEEFLNLNGVPKYDNVSTHRNNNNVTCFSSSKYMNDDEDYNSSDSELDRFCADFEGHYL